MYINKIFYMGMGLGFTRKKGSTPVTAETAMEEEDYLYVVLPYFNFCTYQRRKRLFLDFVERIRNQPKLRIVISEAHYHADQDHPSKLPHNIAGVYRHFRFDMTDHFWVKENLINLAIHRLPHNWKYVAWVDADLTFLNTQWVDETLDKFDSGADVLQLFQSAVHLGTEGETTKLDQGFIYMHETSGKPYTKTYKYGFWHPGYAWAMNRKTYNALDGLIDWGILGSGDHHMALAFIGKVEQSHPGGLTDTYKRKLLEFQQKCKSAKLNIGYVTGTLLHHYHGTLENRKYRERWEILTKGKYDPVEDVHKNKMGVLELTSTGKRLEQEILQYFMERREDE